MSWVALAGAAVAAGTGIYAANQQKKAAGKQASAIKEGTKELEPVLLGEPKKIDTRAMQLGNIDQIFDQLEYANRLTQSVNAMNYREAMRYYKNIQPYFQQIQAQTGKNALSFAKGELPEDVANQIQRQSAERGIQGGYGFGSQGAQQGAFGNVMLRNLGLTSLDLSKYGTELGMKVNQSARQLLPDLMSPMQLFMTPGQQLQAAQFNVGNENDFMVRNNALQNNALMQNTALSNNMNQALATNQYNQSVGQAQMIQQLGGQIGGGLISQYGSAFGGNNSSAYNNLNTEIGANVRAGTPGYYGPNTDIGRMATQRLS